MEEFGISYNEPIIIRGKFDEVHGDSSTPIYLLKSLENDYDILPILIRMNKEQSFIEEGDVILIEAEFLEELAGQAAIMGDGKILSK